MDIFSLKNLASPIQLINVSTLHTFFILHWPHSRSNIIICVHSLVLYWCWIIIYGQSTLNMIPAELPKVLKAQAICKTTWGCDGKEILYTPSHVSMQMTMELTCRMVFSSFFLSFLFSFFTEIPFLLFT